MKKLVIAAAAAVLRAVTEIPRTEPVPEGAYAVWQVPCIQASLPIYEEVGRNGQALNNLCFLYDRVLPGMS